MRGRKRRGRGVCSTCLPQRRAARVMERDRERETEIDRERQRQTETETETETKTERRDADREKVFLASNVMSHTEMKQR